MAAVDEPGDAEAMQVAERELNDAVTQILGRHGLMVTKWMCVAEIIDPECERVLESFASPGLLAWDTLGLLGYLDARERGAVGAEAAQPGD